MFYSYHYYNFLVLNKSRINSHITLLLFQRLCYNVLQVQNKELVIRTIKFSTLITIITIIPIKTNALLSITVII